MNDGLNIDFSGVKWWHQNGLLHREDGPAIEYPSGDKIWCQNDLYHRLDGPAIEWANGSKIWYQNGQKHRLDGPAIEYSSGYNKEWYFYGKRIYCNSQEEFEEHIKLAMFW